MTSVGATEISASELRLRLNEFAGRFGRVIEGAADSIMTVADDLDVFRAARRWKMVAIPTAHRAIFQMDPLAGLIDIWVATVQGREEFEETSVFGDWQAIARDAMHSLESQAEAIALALRTGEHRRCPEPGA